MVEVDKLVERRSAEVADRVALIETPVVPLVVVMLTTASSGPSRSSAQTIAEMASPSRPAFSKTSTSMLYSRQNNG